MDNKEFDDIIKNKLDSLSSGGSDDGWEMFKQKWDDSSSEQDEPEQDTSDDEFDASIKKSLENLRVPFNSLHWIKLKAKLEAEALFKKRLFVAKSVEILMLAFLVIGILNLWPIQKEIYTLPIYDIPMVASIPVDKATADKHAQTEALAQKKQKKVISSVINKVATVPGLSILKFKDNNISEGTSPDVKHNNSSSNKDRLLQPLESIRKDKNLMEILPFLEVQTDNAEAQEDKNNNSITALLDADINQLHIPQRPTGYPDMVLPKTDYKKNEKSYFSLSIGPKVNLVNSPFDPVYAVDPYNTFNTNFNVTAKLQKDLGPLEVYAGLGYHSTSYKPLRVEETYNNKNFEVSKTSLENISFKTFSIPLGVKYDIIDKPSIQLYATAGIDVNIVADSKYDIVDTPLSGFTSLGAASPPKDKNNIANERSLLSQKDFNKGVFSGGTLRDNIYASASIGFGVIKNVSESTSIFVEPKYNHFISSQGLGPNSDKLHAVSIDLGVRYQLN